MQLLDSDWPANILAGLHFRAQESGLMSPDGVCAISAGLAGHETTMWEGVQKLTYDLVWLKACGLVKDLGVQIDSKLKFHNHTTVVTKKANRLVAIIWKTFQHFDKVMLINLYKTFVRPVLEY